MEVSKCIVSEIMNFMWKCNYNPISRNVLYNNKLNVGIGLVNVFLKPKCIYIATIIKNFCESMRGDIIQYYMALRLNPLFGVNMLPTKFS